MVVRNTDSMRVMNWSYQYNDIKDETKGHWNIEWGLPKPNNPHGVIPRDTSLFSSNTEFVSRNT